VCADVSEYQYYEFQAIDRPLTKHELDGVRALSSRARISATHFVNEYHYGNFRGEERKLMEQLYDAHLYFAMPRLPQPQPTIRSRPVAVVLRRLGQEPVHRQTLLPSPPDQPVDQQPARRLEPVGAADECGATMTGYGWAPHRPHTGQCGSSPG
jgi:hypothetical protein